MSNMTDLPKQAPIGGSASASATALHPNGHGKYGHRISYHGDCLTLSVHYVERQWMPIALFGRVVLTRQFRLAAPHFHIHEVAVVSDDGGVALKLHAQTDPVQTGILSIPVLGPEWPAAMREEVRDGIDSALHSGAGGMALKLGTSTILFGLLAVFLIASAFGGTRASATAGAPLPASTLSASSSGPAQVGKAPAAAVSSAEVAQQAADTLGTSMPITEALSKAAFVTVRSPASGAKTVIIWSDPLCPHCRDLEQQVIPKIPKEVGILVVPVAFKNGSRQLVSYVACGADAAERAARWTNLMSEVPNLQLGAQCAAGPGVADANSVLFARAGLKSSPTIMSVDGAMYPGDTAVAEDLIAWVKK